MAKIYETKEDLQRDELKKQLREAENNVSRNVDGAVIGALIATGSHSVEDIAQLRNVKPSGFLGTLNKVLMWAGIISGGLSLISFFNNRSKVAHISGHLDELGPEQIKLPPDHAETICEGEIARKHCDRLQQEVASSTQRAL